MESSTRQGEGGTRPPSFLRYGIEFVIVAGLSLVTIFLIIPAQTQSDGEIGLSPGLLPTVCAAAIACLAVLQFILQLLRHGDAAEPARCAPDTAIKLIAATIAGVAAIRLLGWEPGGAVIAVLVSMVLGERRPVRLAIFAACVAAVLFAAGWSGV